jgi:small conductance mechanosensitive channel
MDAVIFAVDWVNWKALSEKAEGLLLQYGMNALGAILLLLVSWVAAGWVGRLTGAAMRRARVDETLTRFVEQLLRWVVLLFGVLACLSVFGIETTSFAAMIGAIGVAVGLAFQGTLSNFASGVMLLVFRPFKVGDTINAAGTLGKVYAIDIFTTSIDTFDNRRLIIPNSSIFGSTIENVSYHGTRRVEVNISVPHEADVDHTRAVLSEAIVNIPSALAEPQPAVVLQDFNPSGVNWSIWVWAKTDDVLAVKQSTIRAVKLALNSANIDIPLPQMQVRMKPEKQK